jgi:hypothetical protein
MPKKKEKAAPKENRYKALIDKIFFDNYTNGATSFGFVRKDIKSAAEDLGIVLPDNLGDVIYSFRFRTDFSDRILATQPKDMEWRIELAGRAKYRFVLGKVSRIVPNPALRRIKVPDATPELIGAYALDDEQALLAVIRYNRLIDTFLGITTYSLQNHLRTTVKDMGQVEIDELYVGIDTHGCHYVMPVQAKGGSDKISVVQTTQDIRACAEKFPGIACRPISVQFMDESVIALFELTIQDDEIRIVEERHYLLVPAEELDKNEIRAYRPRNP